MQAGHFDHIMKHSSRQSSIMLNIFVKYVILSTYVHTYLLNHKEAVNKIHIGKCKFEFFVTLAS